MSAVFSTGCSPATCRITTATATAAHLNENRVAVSVRAADQHWHDRIIAIMEEFNPIDIDEDGHAVTHERATTGTSTFAATSVPAAGTTARTDLGTAGPIRDDAGPISAPRRGAI